MTIPTNQTNEEIIRKIPKFYGRVICGHDNPMVRLKDLAVILSEKDSFHAQALKDALASQEERHRGELEQLYNEIYNENASCSESIKELQKLIKKLLK